MIKLFQELKRRKVLTTLGVYAGAAFIIIQVAEIVFPRILIPDWAVTFVIILVILGFPITFFLSWTYDLKREIKMDEKPGYGDEKSGKKSRKVLLPLTGFLTIVGGAFWIWYSLGDVSAGSERDLQMGIKKSIAVLNFKNLSGEKGGDYYCSAISEYIRSALLKLGKLDVKHLASENNVPNDLDLDYFIEGTISGTEGSRNIFVSLIDAKSKSYLSKEHYKLIDEQILAYQDTIIKKILTDLKMNPAENVFISNKSEYKDVKTLTQLFSIYRRHRRYSPSDLAEKISDFPRLLPLKKIIAR